MAMIARLLVLLALLGTACHGRASAIDADVSAGRAIQVTQGALTGAQSGPAISPGADAKLITTEYRTVQINGAAVSTRIRKPTNGGRQMMDFLPIATALGGQVETEGPLLTYTRPDDEIVVDLDMRSGDVLADGLRTGRLPDHEPRSSASRWLSPDAISVITGRRFITTAGGQLALLLDTQDRSAGLLQNASYGLQKPRSKKSTGFAQIATVQTTGLYAGVFDERVSQGPNKQVSDWSTAGSWQIERASSVTRQEPYGEDSEVLDAMELQTVSYTPDRWSDSSMPEDRRAGQKTGRLAEPKLVKASYRKAGPGQPQDNVAKGVSALLQSDPVSRAFKEAAYTPISNNDRNTAENPSVSSDPVSETLMATRVARALPVSSYDFSAVKSGNSSLVAQTYESFFRQTPTVAGNVFVGRSGDGVLLQDAPTQAAEVHEQNQLEGTAFAGDKSGDVYGVQGRQLDLPARPSRQLTGALFIDRDGNGRASQGDDRLEGQAIHLLRTGQGQVGTIRSASFGQFGFSGLAPGQYQLRVMIGWQEYSVPVEIIADRDDILTVPIAVPAALMGLPDRQDGQSVMDVATS